VVDAPRLRWWLVRNLFVLPFRARSSARLYAAVWTRSGSPLLAASERLAARLRQRLSRDLGAPVPVALGMRYGTPPLGAALRSLAVAGCRTIVVLPLYPQYSGSTVGSTWDAVAAEIRSWRNIPRIRFISGYHDEPRYIESLAASVRGFWSENGRADRLLLSFHGLPVRYAEAGDPYPAQCEETARLLAARLGLDGEAWSFAYQSRFGREAWLEPATDALLREWGAAGLGSVDVLCPGFAVDCLETLEEIALRGRRTFKEAGGGAFRYIPALNDRDDHVALLADLVRHAL